jgi:hypothetical protein
MAERTRNSPLSDSYMPLDCWWILSLSITIGLVYWIAGYLRWFHQLTRCGRVVCWDDLVSSEPFTRGTLVVNYTREFGRIWWIPLRITEDTARIMYSSTGLLVRRPRLISKAAILAQYPELHVVELKESVWSASDERGQRQT